MNLEEVEKQLKLVEEYETFVITTETVKWLIGEVKRYEKSLKEIEMIGSIGSKYQSLEAQLAIEALKG